MARLDWTLIARDHAAPTLERIRVKASATRLKIGIVQRVIRAARRKRT